MVLFILLLLLVMVLLVLFFITTEFIGFLMTRVPFVPTRRADIEFIVKQLNIGKDDFFFDLGSGNGKVVFLVEKLSGGAQTRGFELSLWTFLYSKIKAVLTHSRAQFQNRNFFKQPWSEATIVYGYLYPPLMRRVEEKFKAECKPGTTAIIRDFPLPTMKPIEVYYRPHNHEIYVYKKD